MITIKKSSLEEYIGFIDNMSVLQLIDKGIKKVLNVYRPEFKHDLNNQYNFIFSDGKYRGEIYICDFGCNDDSTFNGIKPVVVIQNDVINSKSSTTIVAPIFLAKKTYLPSHIYISSRYGLDESSVIVLDQIAVVNQSSLKQKIGVIKDSSTQVDIYIGLKKTMGLWSKTENKSGTMCLCGKCLQSFMWDNDVIVKRADRFQKYKDRCLKCDGFGYNYYIKRKNYDFLRKE